MDVTTGGEPNKPSNEDPYTDYDWVMGALCYAMVEELSMDDLACIIAEARTGQEFDAGVCATIWLKELVNDNESI